MFWKDKARVSLILHNAIKIIKYVLFKNMMKYQNEKKKKQGNFLEIVEILASYNELDALVLGNTS